MKNYTTAVMTRIRMGLRANMRQSLEYLLKKRFVLLPTGYNLAGLDEHRLEKIICLRYTYRASDEGRVWYAIMMNGNDFRLDIFTMGFEGRTPKANRRFLSVRLINVKAGDKLVLSLTERKAWLNGEEVECRADLGVQSRKFIARLELTEKNVAFSRVCAHYLPFARKTIGRDYYFGDDYTDYYLHNRVEEALKLVGNYCRSGKILDVGCALGVYTQAFKESGYNAFGIDISEFAISEGVKRIGCDRVKQCNLDVSDIPFEAAFDVVWMWDVLEHFVDPYKALCKLTRKTKYGGYLFLRTSNADSLTRRLMGADWEGYTDYSHYGVDQVTPTSVARWLGELGWRILKFECSGIWILGVDPVLLGLREAFQNIPELGTMLMERQLGDDLVIVAQKRNNVADVTISNDMRETQWKRRS